MAEFLIQGETLEAASDKIRECLGVEKLSFRDNIGSNGVFNSGAVTVYYQEYVDYPNEYGLNQDVYHDDVFIAYEFVEDNNGILTPVIYKTDINGDEPETPDYQDKHFYVGRATIDGVDYDKWRKIEEGSQDFDWGSVSEKYLYTNVIVDSNKYHPVELPTKIEEVYDAGYDAGYEAGSSEGVTLPKLTNEGVASDLLLGKQFIDSDGNIVTGTLDLGAIDDLTGTTWKLNDSLNLGSFNYNVTFISSGAWYSVFKSLSFGYYYQFCYDDKIAYNSYQNTKWSSSNETYRFVTFTGGADTTNANLIAWIRANAELISDNGYYSNAYVQNIGTYTFFNCHFLVSAAFPKVTSIDKYAFNNCSALINIVFSDSILPASLTTIGDNAFSYCTSLTSITIPDTVTNIGSYAFQGCTSLTSITFNGTQAQWNAITKEWTWNTNVPATTVTCTDGTVTL